MGSSSSHEHTTLNGGRDGERSNQIERDIRPLLREKHVSVARDPRTRAARDPCRKRRCPSKCDASAPPSPGSAGSTTVTSYSAASPNATRATNKPSATWSHCSPRLGTASGSDVGDRRGDAHDSGRVDPRSHGDCVGHKLSSRRPMAGGRCAGCRRARGSGSWSSGTGRSQAGRGCRVARRRPGRRWRPTARSQMRPSSGADQAPGDGEQPVAQSLVRRPAVAQWPGQGEGLSPVGIARLHIARCCYLR